MTNDSSYTVNAYSMVNGKETLMAWATGLNHKCAKAIVEMYHKEGFADIRMKAKELSL